MAGESIAGMKMPEAKRWQASWIISALCTIVVAWLTAGTGLDMTPLIVLISIAWLLVIALLWITTPRQAHLAIKVIATLVLTGLAIVALCWVVRNDRPILQPAIGGVVTQNFNKTAFALDIETLVKNTGRQSGYADRWKLVLFIDGTEIEGKELYGQPLPDNALNEPEMYNQDFPPGKPVRGWLFFGFPTVSHDFVAPYFICNSDLMGRVNLRLSVWDSKAEHEWSQVRNLGDLGKEVCTSLSPLPMPSIEPMPKPKPVTPTLAESVRLLTNTELRQDVKELSDNMRNFETGARQASDGLMLQPTFSVNDKPIDEAVREKRAKQNALFHAAEQTDFRKRYLPEAEAYKDEMLRRLNETRPDREKGLVALQGDLEGTSPISDLADYLEWLSRRLPQ